MAATDGQTVLPIIEPITSGQAVVDKAFDLMVRATIDAVLELSARVVADQPHHGKKGREITRHGRQGGVLKLSDRTLRIAKVR